jgi:FkbM family methyltransferase
MTIRFALRESLYARHALRLKEGIYRRLTRSAPPLFLKGDDNISIAPLVSGWHEIRIKALIDALANQGFGDFLIDIGANIGLISCQSGDRFRQVHMYEPNPQCCEILRVNTRIALQRCEAVLHPVGLGSAGGTHTLHVPRHNWGGAFVHGADNRYDEQQLASKDGFGRFDLANYMQVEIMLVPAREELATLFARLSAAGCTAGVIKIDVEGGEMQILEAVAASLPASFRVTIIFECFDLAFDPAPLLAAFAGRAAAMKLVRLPSKRMNKLRRLWQILTQGGYRYLLRPFAPEDISTDIVLMVGGTSQAAPEEIQASPAATPGALSGGRS